MKRLLLMCLALAFMPAVNSQLLTWSPAFPKDNDNITITVDATKGNRGLLGFTGDVYVHVGAITNLSTGPSNWLHAPFTWGSTNAAAKATPDGPNKWKFTINNPRTFFNLAANEELKAIAILFRAGNCTDCAAQRNADGGDMYVPIYNNNLAVRIDAPPSQPKFIRVPEKQNWTVGTSFTATANASKPSVISLYHNGNIVSSGAGVQTFSTNFTVTAVGNQQLIASANDGTTTTYDTMNIFISPGSSPVAALPAGVQDGINYEPGDTSVTLVLRAPGKTIVTLIGEFNNWIQDTKYILNKTPDGKFFWIRLHPLLPGMEYAYQYMVDDTIKIADPYAEKLLDPDNDRFISTATYPGLKPYPFGQSGIVSVLQTAKPAHVWSATSFTRPDKRGLIIYELLVRDFSSAHNWKTVMDSLNYLKNLGITAVQLMPFNEFEGNVSWGYNPSFYFAPDKYYGTENSLKVFIDSCHAKGIAVIMDMTLNHSFGQSPMVQLYWDAVNNRPAANNPWFNPTARHAFNVGYDMNHESADTKYFFKRVVKFWLEQYRIDGFRFDLSKGFTQTETCPGGVCNVGQWGNYDASRVAIWKNYYDSLQSISPGSYAILEHFAVDQEDKELANYGMLLWNNMNYFYSQAARAVPVDWDFSNGIYSVRGWTNPHLVTYMESHDEERLMYRNLTEGTIFGSYNTRDTTTALKRMELATSFFLTIPGPKMIWQFGELGYDYPINYCTNGTVNNACRLDPKPIVTTQYLNDPRRRSLYNVYSRLNALRNHTWYKSLFLTGTVERSLSGGAKWLKVASGDTSHLVVVGNFDVTPQAVVVTFPKTGPWYNYLDNTTITATGSPQNIPLLPGEYRVYVNRNVNNLNTTPVTAIPFNELRLEASAWPNPSTGQLVLQVQLPQSGVLVAELYSVQGQYLGTIHNGFLQRGEQKITVNQGMVSPGSYFMKLKSGNATKTLQVIIQK